MDFKETVHTLPKIRGIETDQITPLSSQSAEQDQREKTNIIIIRSNSINRDMRGKTTKTGDNATAVLVTALLVLLFVRKCFAVGTVSLSKELHTVSNQTSAW